MTLKIYPAPPCAQICPPSPPSSFPPFDNAPFSHAHTHKYRAFQFHTEAQWFEPRSLNIVNIDLTFRDHYIAFSSTSSLPALECRLRGSSMDEAGNERLTRMFQAANDQRELDECVEGSALHCVSLQNEDHLQPWAVACFSVAGPSFTVCKLLSLASS
ncbi:hypothetical protein VIGAN_04437100 [Vigna angularis var. angularis]|uniref:Uncharacterized protein n=1 Tax=Vigna angularis var. angularis TaxID=157739 RepID=A0A0S3S1L5_PHAAN|nr:hypothetical protein VIGAN_04437100 [Vigna angularis var. angularis]